MPVARVAMFAEEPQVLSDDERRASTLRELVRAQPGFVAGYHLREVSTGRLMSVTIWESEDVLDLAEAVVADRPLEDQRGIEPSVVERWVVDGMF